MSDRALGHEDQARFRPSEAGQPVDDRDIEYRAMLEEYRAPNRYRGLGSVRRGCESEEKVRFSQTDSLGHGSDGLSRPGHEKPRESGLGFENSYDRYTGGQDRGHLEANRAYEYSTPRSRSGYDNYGSRGSARESERDTSRTPYSRSPSLERGVRFLE
jgi:hypothetical protein